MKGIEIKELLIQPLKCPRLWIKHLGGRLLGFIPNFIQTKKFDLFKLCLSRYKIKIKTLFLNMYIHRNKKINN